MDPNLKEEAVMGGRLTMTVNTHGDICAVQKGGGVGVSASELMRCLRIATAKAQVITETLQKAVSFLLVNVISIDYSLFTVLQLSSWSAQQYLLFYNYPHGLHALRSSFR